MDPATVILIGESLQAALKLAPVFVSTVEALKASGGATPEQLAALDAQIEAMDALRRQAWAEADDALAAAAAA